jgi:hypothetical protein
LCVFTAVEQEQLLRVCPAQRLPVDREQGRGLLDVLDQLAGEDLAGRTRDPEAVAAAANRYVGPFGKGRHCSG